MTKWQNCWNGFWFKKGSAADLGFCRLLFCGVLFGLRWQEDYSFVAGLGYTWVPTFWMAQLFPNGVPSLEFMAGLQLIWKISMFTACVGVFTKTSLITLIVSEGVILNLFMSVARTRHEAAPVTLILGVLLLARCADAFSIDVWWKKRRSRDTGATLSTGDYYWPILMCRLVISLVFCNAGFNKLYHGGLDWIFSDNLARLFGGLHETLGYKFSHWAGFWSVSAGVVVFTEFFHPLAILSRRAALYFVPGGLMMLVGFGLLMDIFFLQWFLIHLFWLPGSGPWLWVKEKFTADSGRELKS